MQIQRIKNNNYNTNFGAKLQLQGAVKDLPKELIKEFEAAAKSIGKDTDIISIDIGKKTRETFVWREMREHFEFDYYEREHYIASYVNGKMTQQKIKSNANGHYKNDIENLQEVIIGYLKRLILNK